ncbi:MAG: gliding motility-associated C-terminal domain-containing protein [Flavobacteriales bacterium]|nr:gliding motility-associated C-terminal domain-containing protein [Flavobacteriales bacterium]
MMHFHTSAAVACLFTCAVMGQGVELSVEQYQQLKLAGALPAEFHVNHPTLPPPMVQHAATGGALREGGGCDCWIEPDSTYSLAMLPNDDFSSPEITLPFQFNLYGDLYSTCFVNNNGNVSFLLPHPTYSAFSFPVPSFRMVAAFWGDVDTRNGGGTVRYKLTGNALYVNWTDVGYFSEQTDKRNTFQLIISDGTNTDVGIGQTVSFCYKQMEWTTGSASCVWDPASGYTCSNALGSYSCSPGDGLELGFCGTPATVGANRGNAVDFAQFGRFNMPGTAYDGPFGQPDEVGWLSYKNFVFTTATSSANIAPVASGSSLCDTVKICVDEPVHLDVDFLAPEAGQTTTASFAITPPLVAPVAAQNSGAGNPSSLQLQFTPTDADTGLHVITYSATDNGTPPLTTEVSVVLQVAVRPTVQPLITADTLVCDGQTTPLTASGGYAEYHWSNGATGQEIQAGPGTYFVEAGANGCGLVSDTLVVHGIPAPAPVITGGLVACGNEPAVLSITEPYANYFWSNGEATPSVSVDTGSYTVTVTNAAGCPGSADPVTVLGAPDPIAFFTAQPAGEVYAGTTVEYTDQSNGNGGVITSWSWDLGSLGSGSGGSIAPVFTVPGHYPVMLTVTSADGCSSTYTYVQVVIPTEIVVPNVFSPNGDGENDALVFEGGQYFPNTSLKVYNRWGQAVFASGNYKNTWSPGKELPEGTYFFILRLADGREFTGHVTLLR